MKLFQIVWAVALFTISASVLAIVVSFLLRVMSGREGLFFKVLVASLVAIAVAFVMGMVGIALWVLGI